MITKKGNIEVEVNGQTIGFRISTWTFREAQIKLGANSIDEVWEITGLMKAKINVETYLIFVYEAISEYKRNMGIDIPDSFSLRDVSEQLDLIGGIFGSIKYITEGIQHYTPKNSEAPATEQEVSA